jgi:hypothetical protein
LTPNLVALIAFLAQPLWDRKLATVAGLPAPYLASLGSSLALWRIGCAMDSAAS